MKPVEFGLSHPIRVIAFDAVGTLIYPDPPVRTIYHSIGCRYGSKLSESEVAARFGAAFAKWELLDRHAIDQHGTRTSEEVERIRWRGIVSEVLHDVTDIDHCFEDLFAHFAEPSAWKCFADVDSTLEQLEAAGYQLAIASNFDHRLHAICDGLAPLRRFQLRVISSIVGHRKPGREFYAAVVAAANCPADQIVMVGDDFENDIVGARDAGLQTVYLQRGLLTDDYAIATLSELPEILSR